MTKQTQEALKMAIEAIENLCEAFMLGADWKGIGVYDGAVEALIACKEAIAAEQDHIAEAGEMVNPEQSEYMVNDGGTGTALRQPKQEPYCWMGYGGQTSDHPVHENSTPLYTHPAQPLSDEEINAIYEQIKWDVEIKDIVIDFARAVEQAHGIGVKGE